MGLLYIWSPVVSSISVLSYGSSYCFSIPSETSFVPTFSSCILVLLPLFWVTSTLSLLVALSLENLELLSSLGGCASIMIAGSYTTKSVANFAYFFLLSSYFFTASLNSSCTSWSIASYSMMFLYVKLSTTGSVGIETVWFTSSRVCGNFGNSLETSKASALNFYGFFSINTCEVHYSLDLTISVEFWVMSGFDFRVP